MVSELVIGPGTRVTLHFALSLEDGTEVDSNYGGKPASFEFGDGNLLPGFEESIVGLREGDSTTLEILPEQGFGAHNPVNVQTLKRTDFAEDIELHEGLVVNFQDAAGGDLPGIIADYNDDEVIVDFNHPLAGRTISFSVQILQVSPAVTH